MANNITAGRITIAGSGAAGLRVEVYDQDYILGIPFAATKLGDTTYTNSDGDYRVSYSPDEYGPLLDEDRVTTSWPASKPANPDIFIKVFQGGTLLHTTSVQRDVESDSCSIDLDLPADPQAERSWLEQIGDAVVDGISATTGFVADLAEAGGDAIGGAFDILLGSGSGDGVRASAAEWGGRIRRWGESQGDLWDNRSGRTSPFPEDLWQLCQERYRNYKRDLLLRHFLPPDRSDPRYQHERAIPFLVSSGNRLGRIDPHAAPRCSPTDRYSGSEMAPLLPLPQVGDTAEEWDDDRWRDHLRRHGDAYCRTYENGLAYTGSFIACLAIEYAMAASSPNSTAGYRQECEDLITLALDAIEDLERRGGLPGYLIRYHEDGDCATYAPEGDLLCHLAWSAAAELDSGQVPASICSELVLTGAAVIRKVAGTNQAGSSEWLIVDGETVYLVRHLVSDIAANHLGVFKAHLQSCGFREAYCLPLKGDCPEGDAWKEEQRQRMYEPSGDEYVHLLEGLSVACWLLPAGSGIRERIEALLTHIRQYLLDHFYYLLRPCGNFTSRGPYTPIYEFPFSCLFEAALAATHSDVSAASTEEVFGAAGITGAEEIHCDDNVLMVVEQLLRPLPPRGRFAIFFLGTAISDIDLPAEQIQQFVELLPEDVQHAWDELRHALQGGHAIAAPIPVWTLWMLAKACLLGRGASAASQDELSNIYRAWFDSVGDRQFRTVRGDLGHAYNPVTLATAVSLLGRRTNAVWRKWRRFFNADNSRDFPVDHVPMQVNHAGEDTDTTPGATGVEKVGEAALIQFMWPFATIAGALGRPLDAGIDTFTEEEGMPGNAELRARLEEAMSRH